MNGSACPHYCEVAQCSARPEHGERDEDHARRRCDERQSHGGSHKCADCKRLGLEGKPKRGRPRKDPSDKRRARNVSIGPLTATTLLKHRVVPGQLLDLVAQAYRNDVDVRELLANALPTAQEHGIIK